MAKKSKVKSVEVYVSYKGHHNVTKDKAITEVFGRSEVGSGYNLMNGTRDLHFSFSTRKAAEKAIMKLHKAVTKVKVVIDENEESL